MVRNNWNNRPQLAGVRKMKYIKNYSLTEFVDSYQKYKGEKPFWWIMCNGLLRMLTFFHYTLKDGSEKE